MSSNPSAPNQQLSGSSSSTRIASQEPGWTRLEGGFAGGEALAGAVTGQRFWGEPTASPQPQSSPVPEDIAMEDGSTALPSTEAPDRTAPTAAAPTNTSTTADVPASRPAETGTAAQNNTPPIKQEPGPAPTASNISQAEQASNLIEAVEETATSSDLTSERGDAAPAAASPANAFGVRTADGTGVILPDGEVLRFESPPLEGLGQAPPAGDRRDVNGQTFDEALRPAFGAAHPHAAVFNDMEQYLRAEWHIVAESDTHVTVRHREITYVVTRAGFDRIGDHVYRGRHDLANLLREVAGPAPPTSRLDGDDDRSRRRRSMLATVSGLVGVGQREEDANTAQAAEDADTGEEQEAEVSEEDGGNDETTVNAGGSEDEEAEVKQEDRVSGDHASHA